MKSKTRRVVYRVKWEKNGKWWIITQESGYLPTSRWSFVFKKNAIIFARREARFIYRSGDLSQVVIHGKNGKIQKEWTYGKDPKRSRG